VGELRADIQPELWVHDGPAAVAFYERAFGAVVEHRVDGPGADDIVAQLSVSGARFWVSSASEKMRRFSPRAISGATGRVLLVVDNPEALMIAAVLAGATQTSPVGREHGWLLGRLVDPSGHEWEVGRPLGAWPPEQRL
jgi:PhnB protein